MRARRWGVLAVLLVACASAAVSLRASPLGQARSLAATGQKAASRALLDSLLAAAASLDPEERAEAERLQLQLESDGARYEAGLRTLLARENEPAVRAFWELSLGHALFAQGKLREARTRFHHARELGREEEGSLWEGLSALAMGSGPAAREALRRASISGNLAIRERSLVALGDTYRLAGRYGDALPFYQGVREAGHTTAGWWAAATLAEAQCLYEVGQAGKAGDRLRLLLQRAPRSYEAATAQALLARRRPEKAAATAAVPVQPGSAREDSTRARYAVQVGAFALSENAKMLAERIATKGFGEARVEAGADGLYRVLVGGVSSRAQAETLGDSLGTALGVGFSIVREKGN